MYDYGQVPHESLPEKVKNDIEHFSTHLSRSEIIAYDVVEKIHLIPGLGQWASKDVRFHVRFQNLPNGVKACASAPAGVTVYGEYRVEFRDVSEVQDTDRPAESGWWLVEDTTVECLALMMPLVAWNLDSAHRGMLEQLLGHLQKEQGPGSWEDRPPAPPPKD